MLIDLCATSGQVDVPISEKEFQTWLSVQEHSSCAHMTPTDMIRVLLVRLALGPAPPHASTFTANYQY